MAYGVLDVCRHIINYSNKRDYFVSNLKLQKILYFVQAYFLINTKDCSPCFAETIEAWDFGPVVPIAYHEYKRFGMGGIPSIQSYVTYSKDDIWDVQWVVFKDDVVKEDKILVDEVVDEFANWSTTDLVSLTCRQTPWIETYIPYQNNEIKVEATKRFFDN